MLGQIEEELKKLNENVVLTEYEKARKPLEKENSELYEEIFNLKKGIRIYREIIHEILCSIEGNYINLPVNIEAKTIDINAKYCFDKPEIVSIPIKDGLIKSINERINELEGSDK